MNIFTPEGRLYTKTVKLAAAAEILSLSAGVCAQFTAADDAQSACIFSDILNTIHSQQKSIKHASTCLSDFFMKKHNLEGTAEAVIFDHYEGLTAIQDQLADFARLVECAVEANKTNHQGFSAYFALRLTGFSQRLAVVAAGITNTLKSEPAEEAKNNRKTIKIRQGK